MGMAQILESKTYQKPTRITFKSIQHNVIPTNPYYKLAKFLPATGVQYSDLKTGDRAPIHSISKDLEFKYWVHDIWDNYIGFIWACSQNTHAQTHTHTCDCQWIRQKRQIVEESENTWHVQGKIVSLQEASYHRVWLSFSLLSLDSFIQAEKN